MRLLVHLDPFSGDRWDFWCTLYSFGGRARLWCALYTFRVGLDLWCALYIFGRRVNFWCAWIHFWGVGETFGAPWYTFGGLARLLVYSTLLGVGRDFCCTSYTLGVGQDFWCAWIHFWGDNFINFKVVKMLMKALNALKSDDKNNPLILYQNLCPNAGMTSKDRQFSSTACWGTICTTISTPRCPLNHLCVFFMFLCFHSHF